MYSLQKAHKMNDNGEILFPSQNFNE